MFRCLIVLVCFINLSGSHPQAHLPERNPVIVNYIDRVSNDLAFIYNCSRTVNVLHDAIKLNILIPCDRPIPSNVSTTDFVYDFQIFLCMGVYDSLLRSCELEKRHSGAWNIPPVQVQEIDESGSFCKKLQAVLPFVDTSYTQTVEWVTVAKKSLAKPDVCRRVCNYPASRINPLCSFMYIVNSFNTSSNGKSIEDQLLPSETGNIHDDKNKILDGRSSSIPDAGKTANVSEDISGRTNNNFETSGKLLTNSYSTAVMPGEASNVGNSDGKDQDSLLSGNNSSASSLVRSPNGNNGSAEVPDNPTSGTVDADQDDRSTNDQQLKSNNTIIEEKLLNGGNITERKLDIVNSKVVEKSSEGANAANDSSDPSPNEENLGNADPDMGTYIVLSNETSTLKISTHERIGTVRIVSPHEGVTVNHKATDSFVDAEDSHFFVFFVTMVVLCMIGYLAFHNKQKILAMALEGHSKRSSRRQRPNTTKYRKLDSNLEEAVTSSCKQVTTNVIY